MQGSDSSLSLSWAVNSARYSGRQSVTLPGKVLQPRVPGKKLPQKDNADRGVQLTTPAGPRQSLLLAKDPSHFL